MRKLNILVLCTGNSCRSQMAARFSRHHASERFDVYSAGTEPAAAVHPLAIQVMRERGIDISSQRPQSVAEFLGRLTAHVLIIVCTQAEERCPRIFPGMAQRLFWPFDDPATATGNLDELLEEFRQVRDAIELRIKQWVAEQTAAT